MGAGYQSCTSTTLKTFLAGSRPELELVQCVECPRSRPATPWIPPYDYTESCHPCRNPTWDRMLTVVDLQELPCFMTLHSCRYGSHDVKELVGDDFGVGNRWRLFLSRQPHKNGGRLSALICDKSCSYQLYNWHTNKRSAVLDQSDRDISPRISSAFRLRHRY